MIIDLTGRVAVITGAGRGIGRDIARRLATEGVHVVGLDVNAVDLESLPAELAEFGATGDAFVCDITNETRVTEVISEVLAKYSRIDVLINNAGIGATAPTDLLDVATWRRVHEVNLTGTFIMSKAVIPAMKAQRSGRIINAASFAAIIPSVAHAAYASSKMAVVQFTRVLAGELGPWNITVNSYAPGMVPTQLNHFTEREELEQARLLGTLSLRRWESTDDIANLLCFLASDEASYLTGTLIDISGGKFATQNPGAAYDYAETGDLAMLP
jgi:3-oxoacyl-[acyl-carrier protein] reductase